MAERDIHRNIVKFLQQQGAYAVKTAPPMENGTPDIVACLRGVFMGIEVKRPGQSPSKIQQHRMRQIKEAGGLAFVATSVADVREQMEALVIRLAKVRAEREAAANASV